MRVPPFILPLVAGLICSAAVLSGAAAAVAESEKAQPNAATALLRQLDSAFVQIYEKVAPSVVVLEVVKKPAASSEETRSFDFFLDEGKEPRGKSAPDHSTWRLPQQRSEGSGFFISSDG